MKKLIASVVLAGSLLSLAACGGGDEKTIVVGASPVPHAEILEQAKDALKEKGYTLEIKEFNDYVLPNKALNDKEIDANYFQHVPYLEAQIADNGYDFVNAGGVHIEPIGVYSKKYKSLEELPEGAVIIMSNSVADHGRILTLLQAKGLIKLNDGVDTVKATIDDIAENPKNLVFKADIDAALLAKAFENNEGDAVLINTNYAIDAGLNPLKDAIAIEGSDSPYTNIITVRNGDEDSEKIKALVEVLQSDEVQDWIGEKYEGAVVPAAGK